MEFRRLLGGVAPTIATLAVTGALTMASAAQFTADVVITGPGGNYTLKLHVRDNLYRLQKVKGPMNVSPYPTIVNRDTGLTWGLNDQVRQYVQMKDIDKTAMMNPLVGWKMTRKGMTERPGSIETVNGYECETFLYSGPGGSEPAAKVWYSRRLDHIVREERFGMNENPVLELRNIQEGPVDSSLFKIPAGYTKMDTGRGAGDRPSTPASKKAATASALESKTRPALVLTGKAQTATNTAPLPVPASSSDQGTAGSNPAAASSGNLVFILDASGSMWGQVEGKAKIAIAKEVLTGLIKDLPDDAVVGLVAYGHRRKGDCKDVEELAPLGKVNKNKLIRTIQEMSPKGKTPITLSVRNTAERIKHLEDETAIILVSDGKETCEGDPCALVKELREAGIRFVMHVIGFDVTEEERTQLECMAKAGGGEYFTAKTAKDFQLAAREVVKKAAEKPPVSLKVTSIKDGKPFKAYVEILTQGGEKRVTESWTSVEKPAAFRLLPGIYDIRAQDHSVIQRPTVDIQDVEIVEGRTTERIANFATEGVLRVKAIKKNAPAKTYVKVFRQDDEKYMGDGWTREDGKAAEFKLLPGRYKVSFQDQSVAQRPVVWIENVEVKADQTVERFATFVEGGVLGVTANKNGSPYKAYVKVYQQQDDKYMGDGWTREDGKAAEYNLLPGAYYAKVEDRKDRSVREIRDIQVQSGKTITVSAAFPVAEEVRTTVKKPKTAPAPTPQTQPQAAPTPKTGSGGTAPSESGDQQGSSEAVMNGRAPLMDGAKVIKEMTYGPNTRVDLEIPATPEEIVNFYKQALTAKGWQLGMAMIQGNTGVLQLKKDGGQLVIKAQGQGQKSKVSMALMGQ